ncbi:aminoglycoside 6-adenylyltransferase [Bacillus sp. Marseille-Q3570]|uniref:aminoglycoside 6-adenylyltransferase n=1 Tax=Bacillus sp. Marseille-Q3570 TaxID=2963522 RepID=UPI0021B7833E|nr:hypothetical protein [Bacillus sp. Marseille-Q3570]
MGFVNKHEYRNSELPNYRKALLRSIEKDLQNDDNVIAFFYGGSIGNENMDYYSDIDLRVVVKPQVIKEYIRNKKKRPNKWGNVLFYEDINPFSNYTVVHYDCFVKVDSFYFKPDDIKPSVWLKNIKIVKDSNHMMASILGESTTLNYKPTFNEFELWRTKFLPYLHEAYRRAMRKEYYYALNCIDGLRLSMCTAWHMKAEIQPNAFGDWAKYEGVRSKLTDWQRSLLESWECGRSTEEIISVMRSIVHEFREVHRSLCNKLEVEEDPDWVKKAVDMVL